MKNWNVRQEDIDAYLKVCKDAAENDEVFAVFKSLPAYRKILEHTSYKQGEYYYNRVPIVYGTNPFGKDFFTSNDEYGKPERFQYGDIVVSPTTLQYVYVFYKLEELFGSLKGRKIVEIGGGYGGQCKIIHDYCKPHSYEIYDLPEVVELQMKYLTKHNVKAWGFWKIKEEDIWCDLVISNYALSEITEPLQTEYVRKVLLNSEHGYITCNGPIHAMQEIKDKFPSFKISPDIEGERKENFIITW